MFWEPEIVRWARDPTFNNPNLARATETVDRWRRLRGFPVTEQELRGSRDRYQPRCPKDQTQAETQRCSPLKSIREAEYHVRARTTLNSEADGLQQH